MMNDTTVISEIQGFVDFFGLGISKEKLAEKTFYFLDKNGHDCWILNGKYIGYDGEEFQFIKSRKEDRWIVKPLR